MTLAAGLADCQVNRLPIKYLLKSFSLSKKILFEIGEDGEVTDLIFWETKDDAWCCSNHAKQEFDLTLAEIIRGMKVLEEAVFQEEVKA